MSESTYDSVIPILQAALYFGVDRLVLECKTWFCDIMCKQGLSSEELELDDFVQLWDFGLEHGMPFSSNLRS